MTKTENKNKKVLIAQEIEIPKEAFDFFNKLGGIGQFSSSTSSWDDMLADGGLLSQRHMYSYSMAVLPMVRELLKAQAEFRKGSDETTKDDFSTVMTGLAISYTLGHGRWESFGSDGGMRYVLDVLKGDELMEYDEVKFRSGKTMSIDEFGHIIVNHLFSEEVLDYIYNEVYPPKGLLRKRGNEPGKVELFSAVGAVIMSCDNRF